MEKSKKFISGTEAYSKITKWCAYQERAQQEVRDKLYDFGLHKEEVEQLLTRIISEGFVNEERFAISFANGKLNQLGWGRVKIRYALKAKKVSDYCIKKAINSLDENKYIQILEDAFHKRNKMEKEKHPLKRKYKLMSYLASRGFEQDLIASIIK
ncbi:MAG: regulatory protein RecX [Bacteroidota bacterium]|jgi:regulatory protein